LIDAGQTAVAAAEDRAFGGTPLDEPLDRRFVDDRVAVVTGGAWWQSCGPAVLVSVPPSGTCSSSARSRRDRVEIRLADPQLSLATIAHELAHGLAGVDHGHDANFRAAFVDVVTVLAGAEHAAALSEAFVAMGIGAGRRRWPPPYRAAGDGFVVVTA
jgi:hypothetical protein